MWGAPTFSCWQYQRLKGHTKFRGGARFRHEGLHHGNRPPETQERWKSIQQTRSPWCSSMRDRASIARCKTVARYQEERQEGKDNKQTNKRKKTKKINEGILKSIQKNDRADDKKKSKPLSGRGERLDELEDRAELVAKRRCSPDDDNMCEGVHEGWTQGDLTIDQASGLVQDPKVEVLLLHCGELEWSSSQ